MLNANKIIYSLRVNIELQKRGFTPITAMKNPYKPELFCWVYKKTPDFIMALNDILKEE